MKHHSGLRAFNAPELEMEPLRSGDFVGSLETGSPVNFYNIKLNPHGNCTHTESVLHINAKGKTINETLNCSHFIAKLVSTEPKCLENGDCIIDQSTLSINEESLVGVEALVIRTLPNDIAKKDRNYSGSNPCYFDPELLAYLSDRLEHVLLDLPSVDKEVDGGALLAHNAFWQTEGKIHLHKTITEFVYVADDILDGLYLLNIQTLPLELDVSPSRPVLFRLIEQ
jgi:kynurenine formamidase